MCRIGECYYYGRGVLVNYEKAVDYLHKAASDENPSSTAMRLLAKCYANGRGVKKDTKRADYWMEQAANAKDDEAIRLMSFLKAIQ